MSIYAIILKEEPNINILKTLKKGINLSLIQIKKAISNKDMVVTASLSKSIESEEVKNFMFIINKLNEAKIDFDIYKSINSEGTFNKIDAPTFFQAYERSKEIEEEIQNTVDLELNSTNKDI